MGEITVDHGKSWSMRHFPGLVLGVALLVAAVAPAFGQQSASPLPCGASDSLAGSGSPDFSATPPPGTESITPPPNLPTLPPDLPAAPPDIPTGRTPNGCPSPVPASGRPQPGSSGSTGGLTAAQILTAALAAYGMPTAWPGTACSGEATPPNHLGNCACAAAVSQVLTNAGYTGATSYSVPTLEADLIAAGWTVVPAGSAQPGDVAIAPGQEHVGICTAAQCTSILSNSSSASTFSWYSGANFDGDYGSSGEVILAPPGG